MFRQLAASIPGGAEFLFRLHPVELSALLDEAWNFRINDRTKPLGHPDHRSDLPGLPEYLLRALPGFDRNKTRLTSFDGEKPECPDGFVRWEHLIYAYMIENTRVLDIFRRVVRLYREGEELGVPTDGSEHWLRNTEELFYREPAPFFITALTSQVRPQLDAIWRNAYYRLFGMDLNHGTEDGSPYPYPKPAAANTQFVNIFEEFLREVWIGIINVGNNSGPNPTDTAKIEDLADRLADMLTTRGLGSNISREAFSAVATMSWFHLTLEFDSPIVRALKAQATSAEQRLFMIAERVRLPAHAMSKSFFDIADAVSRLLTAIESGIFSVLGSAPALFTGPISDDVRKVITHWSIATGHDLKAGKVATS
jgi:hypothetical protein